MNKPGTSRLIIVHAIRRTGANIPSPPGEDDVIWQVARNASFSVNGSQGIALLVSEQHIDSGAET